MKGKQRWMRWIGVALLPVLLAGCKATGGGWIPSTIEGKATFGFSAKCVDEETATGDLVATFAEGQLQYQDRAAGVQFHAVLDPTSIIFNEGDSCKDLKRRGSSGGNREFSGTYYPQPDGASGTIEVYVYDSGEGGIKQDYFRITLSGGEYPTYTNEGTVQGGNLHVK